MKRARRFGTTGWRRAAIVPILALALLPLARAVDPVDRPGAATEPSSAPPPAAPAATKPVEESSGWFDLLAPLRQFGVESWWDVIQLQPWTGTIGFTFDDQEQRVKTPGTPTQTFSSRLLAESFTISNDNFAIVDPRLFTGSLMLGVMFQQGWQNAFGIDQRERATLGNYAFDGTFLPETAYNLNLFALRSQNTYVQPSGSTTHTDIRNAGVGFQLRETSILREREILPYFSANLRAYQQYEKQTTTLGGQSFRQDDRREQVQAGFQNGTETSDLNFQYQYTKLDNYAYTAGSYDSQNANVYYSIDFGPTLNWRSDSRLNYYDRNGVNSATSGSDLKTLEANEYLTIDHNADLSSNYNYQLTRQDASDVGTATTQSFGIQVNEQVFRNLSLTEGATVVYSQLPGGTVKAAGVAGNFNYGHAVLWEGQLSLAGGAGYLVTTTEVPAGTVPVVDAPYVVPPTIGAGSRILLRDRNIETATIVVVVIKSGGVRFTAVLDVDYTVEVDGDRTYVVPLASSALMQPGDPLNISYVYQIAPSSKFRTVSSSGSVGIDWPNFGFNYSHDQVNETPLAGSSDTLLFSERRDAGAIYVRRYWNTFQVRLGAALTSYDSTRLQYVERRLDQYLSYYPTGNLQLNLAATESRTEYQLPVHTTTTNSVRFDAQWWWGAWQTSAYAAWRNYTDTQQPSETVTEAGFRLRRTWTKLDVNIAAALQYRTRGNVSSPNAILHIGAVRHF